VSSAICAKTFFNDKLNDDDLPIRNIKIGSNKTIDGRQSKAYFLFNGFAIGSDSGGEPVDTESSVILTNLRFQGAGHTEDHKLDPDMIRSTGASHDIWIHQNTFDLTGDSAFDVKVGAYNVTISFNLVKNVKRATLHGSSDSRTINEQITTTMHHNAFITSDEFYDEFGNTGRRVPLIRRGKSHMFNNVFYNYRKEILSVRVGGRVAFEDNMFLANPTVADDEDIDYYKETLLKDFREGGLKITGSRVWMSNAFCYLDDSNVGDLTASHGTTPDMLQDYSDASQKTIQANRLEAGTSLADYVLATAGKDGAAPFNSPYTPGRSEIEKMPHRACINN
jgi:pectate lyase